MNGGHVAELREFYLEPFASNLASILRGVAWVGILLGIGIASFCIILGAVVFPPTSQSTAFNSYFAIGLGLCLGGALAVRGIQGLPRVAQRLTVSDGGIEFGLPRRGPVSVHWGSPRQEFTIDDERSIADESRLRRFRGIQFILTCRRLKAPIPLDCALAIIIQAKSHGWSVNGWRDVPTPPRPRGFLGPNLTTRVTVSNKDQTA